MDQKRSIKVPKLWMLSQIALEQSTRRSVPKSR